MPRQAYIDRFYEILDRNLRTRRAFALSTLNSLRSEPELRDGGVYLAFEPGEVRQNGTAKRVVRIGKSGALYNRFVSHALLSDESAFFDLVWQACAAQHRRTTFNPFLRMYWKQIVANQNAPARDMLNFESNVVLPHMQSIELTWVPCDTQQQEKIEKNATILLSNYGKAPPIDPPSPQWLGRASPSRSVRDSGLWSQRLWIGQSLAPDFLDQFDRLV